MSKFTTRVELHEPDANAYSDLHEKMGQAGFTRTIIVDEVTYRLPMAEYNISGDFTRQEVLDRAKGAARRVQENFSVLVTKSDGRTIYNLDEA